MRQLKLPLWKVLHEAARSPETAELDQLWQEVEASIVDLECAGQLQVAGEAISQITAMFEVALIISLAIASEQTEAEMKRQVGAIVKTPA